MSTQEGLVELRLLPSTELGAMGQLFAKKHQAAPPPNVDQDDMALLDLKAQRDQLLSSRRRVDSRSQKAHEVARTLVAKGQKKEAMLALRRWEQQKRLGEDCQNHLAKLEELIFSIEMAQTTRGTVEALKTGVAMMKRIQKDIGGVDQVQRLLGDQEEAIEAQQEIAAMLAGDGVEDAEMLSELSRLQEEAALSTLTKEDPQKEKEPIPAVVPPETASAEEKKPTPTVESSTETMRAEEKPFKPAEAAATPVPA
ncbi:unnamed protein product [Durusdinium trenchii]|uniref:Charged multivesicular body protein 6 n=1 Tax=Durusdinium trenchii TaxID=1381693 RepID=A0ABP0RF73_9DINO